MIILERYKVQPQSIRFFGPDISLGRYEIWLCAQWRNIIGGTRRKNSKRYKLTIEQADIDYMTGDQSKIKTRTVVEVLSAIAVILTTAGLVVCIVLPSSIVGPLLSLNMLLWAILYRWMRQNN